MTTPTAEDPRLVDELDALPFEAVETAAYDAPTVASIRNDLLEQLAEEWEDAAERGNARPRDVAGWLRSQMEPETTPGTPA